MKYIDSEKLKTEIRIIQQSLEHKDVYLNQVKKIRTESMIELCKCIIGVIDSLQQDHLPDAGKMVEQEHIADVSKMMEQPEVDFEKFISDFIDKKDAENNGRWCEEDIIEAMTQSYKFGRKRGLEV